MKIEDDIVENVYFTNKTRKKVEIEWYLNKCKKLVVRRHLKVERELKSDKAVYKKGSSKLAAETQINRAPFTPIVIDDYKVITFTTTRAGLGEGPFLALQKFLGKTRRNYWAVICGAIWEEGYSVSQPSKAISRFPDF